MFVVLSFNMSNQKQQDKWNKEFNSPDKVFSSSLVTKAFCKKCDQSFSFSQENQII